MRNSSSYKRGDVILGRFVVGDIFKGGMSEVYLCFDQIDGILIGLKTWHSDQLADEQTLGQFTEELAVWMEMQPHPNIVHCLGLAKEGQRLFMQLEWITSEEGKQPDLSSRLDGTALPPQDALRVAIDICRGLLHAQSQHPGFVHRDLKPGNILITPNRRAKITDFGLATFFEKLDLKAAIQHVSADQMLSMTGINGFAGTPLYMAPEQWMRQPVDERTDVYAIGCILYEMLAGVPPYQPTTLEGLQREHLFVDLPALQVEDGLPQQSTTKPGFFSRLFGQSQKTHPRAESLSEKVNSIIVRCTAKSSNQRYTVKDLTNVLTSLYAEYFGRLEEESGRELLGLEYAYRALTFLMLGLVDKALENAETAARIDPNDKDVFTSLGEFYYRLGQAEKALTYYNRALQLDPRHFSALSARGDVYDHLQEYDKALADLNLSIAINPSWAPAFNNRCVTYKHLGRYDLALQDAKQATSLNPNYGKAYNNWATTLMSMGRGSEALPALDRAINIDPYYAKAYFNRGLVHIGRHRPEAALSDFDKAIECDPLYAKAYYWRATIYRRRVRYDKALSDVAKAVELGFRDEDAMNLYAFLAYGGVICLVHDGRGEGIPSGALPPMELSTWYAEGVNLDHAPFASRFQSEHLSSRRPLVIWSAPPSEEVFAELIRVNNPTEIYLCGHNACDDSLDGTVKGVASMCKFAMGRDGKISPKQLAARLGTTEIVITMSLFWLTLKGVIRVIQRADEQGVMIIGAGSGVQGKSGEDDTTLQTAEVILRGSLADIATYRHYFQSSPDVQQDLRRIRKAYFP